MREIKFKRAYFFDEECTQFSHYSEWGVKIKGSEFTSPSYNNFATYFIDYQFTGLTDKNGKEIYEGDRTKEGVIIYENGCFMLLLTDKYEPFKDMKQRLYFTHSNQEITGNIHEQK